MKARFINLKHWLLLTAAGLFGINTACAPSMYGCPMSDYEVKGTVSDADGNPLPGVAVKMRCAADTTDAQGRYDILERNGSWLDTLEVSFHDTADVYADTSVPVSFAPADFRNGDDNWYGGRALKPLDITLRKK